jgi:hypothetical protein
MNETNLRESRGAANPISTSRTTSQSFPDPPLATGETRAQLQPFLPVEPSKLLAVPLSQRLEAGTMGHRSYFA